jgi:hypothetical protein
VEVIEKMEDKKRVRLRTTCVNQEGTRVLDGEALVSPPRPPKKTLIVSRSYDDEVVKSHSKSIFILSGP